MLSILIFFSLQLMITIIINNKMYQYLFRFAWLAKGSSYKSRTCVQQKIVKILFTI